MRLFIGTAFLVVLLFSCKTDDEIASTTLTKIESIAYITENYPPYNYYEGDHFHGLATELLVEIWNNMGVNLTNEDIVLMDWDDGYNKTLSEENTVLFSTAKIPERENLFKWVGPITVINESIIARAGSGITISTEADLANHSIGVVKDYSNISLLNERGIQTSELTEVANAEQLYTKLTNGEVDCIAFSETTGNIIINALGYSPGDFVSVYTLSSTEIYYAFNINTDNKVIEAYQTTLEKLKEEKAADGFSVYEKILSSYRLIQHSDDGITEQMVIDLVEQTAADLETNRDATLTSINNGNAPYKNPGNSALYAFVYDTTVTILAHATNPSLVGKCLKGKPDVTGKNFRDDIVNGALKNGTGWVDYIYSKPDRGGLYQKTSYYKLTIGSTGEKLIVCAGKYK
ncbi:MAG: transporter substrate-binding domain-containing protein [Prolixibacteraceae bacterium]|nr:transporter substrate-binding domain-containing protein [Prolixibacteraceae bacterium]